MKINGVRPGRRTTSTAMPAIGCALAQACINSTAASM
jgi:hypothetical protein